MSDFKQHVAGRIGNLFGRSLDVLHTSGLGQFHRISRQERQRDHLPWAFPVAWMSWRSEVLADSMVIMHMIEGHVCFRDMLLDC